MDCILFWGVRAASVKLDGVDIFKGASHEAFYKCGLSLLADCCQNQRGSVDGREKASGNGSMFSLLLPISNAGSYLYLIYLISYLSLMQDLGLSGQAQTLWWLMELSAQNPKTSCDFRGLIRCASNYFLPSLTS